MHIGKHLARLNPSTVRYDIGSGGTPELTAQDRAAALAAVSDGIGRELLCHVWWPDGARLMQHELAALLADAQRQEWQRREDAMLNAVLAVAENTRHAASTYAEAHAHRWPRMVIADRGIPTISGGYERVRKAVLAEMASNGLCSTCGGRAMHANAQGLIVMCPTCKGTGHLPVSERNRADAMGVAWTTYRDGWHKVYSWTVELCVESQRAAGAQFLDALGG